MKKKIIINGDLKDFVTYCTAVYEVEEKLDTDYIKSVFEGSPIFENRSFDIKVLGTVQKTSVHRASKFFVKEKIVTLQIRYELKTVTDIELKDSDEEWIRSDVSRLLSHFETLLDPFTEG